ncbi:MAG: four helix bundle protein [Clostridia bacterium]|nr:four helix bundle protein [Clostridia bacterium]
MLHIDKVNASLNWLELLFKTNYIDESTYKSLNNACTSIRVMLISSINNQSKAELSTLLFHYLQAHATVLFHRKSFFNLVIRQYFFT